MRCTLLLLSILALSAAAQATPAPVCWKATHDRGVGTIPESCPAGTQKNGALCYPDCKDGFYGVGPVCWEHCPQGWVDEGALCREDGSIRTIAKKSYGRGVGHVMSCAAGYEEDAALCYPLCPAGFDGVGPVCWESCPTIDPVTGGAICCRNGTTCSDKIKDLVGGLPLAVAEAILAGKSVDGIIEAAEKALEAVLGYVMPLCNTLAAEGAVADTAGDVPAWVPRLLKHLRGQA